MNFLENQHLLTNSQHLLPSCYLKVHHSDFDFLKLRIFEFWKLIFSCLTLKGFIFTNSHAMKLKNGSCYSQCSRAICWHACGVHSRAHCAPKVAFWFNIQISNISSSKIQQFPKERILARIERVSARQNHLNR